MAEVLREHMQNIVPPENDALFIHIHILSGVALRDAGWDEASTYLAGNDISSAMLDIAKERKCYDDIKLIDLNNGPFNR